MLDALQAIWDWFAVGIYDFFVSAFAWFSIKWATWKIEMNLLMIQLAWEVAGEVIASFQLTEKFTEYVGMLNADTKNALAFFNIFAGIDILFKACITRFILNFMRG